MSTAPPTCRAPLVSMYLDQHGDVRACCMNLTHPLGNIRDARLLDIWQGDRARALRSALVAGDLSLGCEWCQGPIDDGRPDLAFARWFDRFEVDDSEAAWPRQIELSVSNTCNLQCVMCNGDWSSSIRSRREGRPPLPVVYDEPFFADLDAFLPRLEHVKFLGGEPFLAAETLRVMERLVAFGLSPTCHITTNGTQWTPRVERLLDLLPVNLSLSLDAATGPTYEAIRVGARWDAVMANLLRFRERSMARDRLLSLTYCLMRPNWHEFGRFCRLADDLGLPSTVNTVTQPTELSLYWMDRDDLATVVRALEEEGARIRDRLTLSAPTWDGELARLRGRLDELDHEAAVELRTGRGGADRDTAGFAEWRRAHVAVDAARIHLSARSRVESVEPGGPLAALDGRVLLGRVSTDLLVLLRGLVPGVGEPVAVDERDGCQALRIAVEDGVDWAVLVEPGPDKQGEDGGATVSISSVAALRR